MPLLPPLARRARAALGRHPRLRKGARAADRALALAHQSVALAMPALIRPTPRQITIAITARCNLRCVGCRYERDFMLGEELSLDLVEGVLEDARDAGVATVRFYGGEPLLHRELPAMILRATALGMDSYVTTNGLLLASRIDDLVASGLKWLTIGFYGSGDRADTYTQRGRYFDRLSASVAAVRARHREAVELQLNYVVVPPFWDTRGAEDAWAFARRHDMFFHIDLSGSTIPFFTPGPSGELLAKPEDREDLEKLSRLLVALKKRDPGRFPQSERFLRSIPDWLILGTEMRVPCDAHQLLWVGADGSVQLCDVAFPLGNVRESRLRDLVFTEEHRSSAREGFLLRCPNCTCKCDSRIDKHLPSRWRYRRARTT